MTNIKIQQRSISFAASKAKFSNGTLQVDSSSNESILDKKFKYEIELPGVIHTTARKNNVGGGLNELNLKKETNSAVSEPNAVKKKKVTFANPEISDNEYKPAVSLSTLFEYTEYMPQDKKAQTLNLALKGIMKTMQVYESVNAFDDTFEQNNYQKSSDSHQAQATVDDKLFEGINDSTPCLIPQKSEVLTAAKNELETIKFLKTLSKKEREDLGFSPKQQNNQKVETSRKTSNKLPLLVPVFY
ncbi:MAG: hypothetical protein LKM43_05295 [Wolbachia endosymbiont of Penenirmus auritus]|nr:hypothetical protein [Wolbachia endosymbiont of Penenirmus auritus]